MPRKYAVLFTEARWTEDRHAGELPGKFMEVRMSSPWDKEESHTFPLKHQFRAKLGEAVSQSKKINSYSGTLFS